MKKGQTVYFRDSFTGKVVEAVILDEILVIEEAKAYEDGLTGKFKKVNRKQYDVETKDGKQFSFVESELFTSKKSLLN